MRCYKIMQQNVSERQLSEFLYLQFHLYSVYIKVNIL
jgi:hypothetical protein